MSQYDKISLDRIETAHPSIREDLRKAFMQASDKLTGKVFLRLSYVLRTFDEQAELGRVVIWKNGVKQGIVTYANAGQSFHNYGFAFDIVLIYRNAPKASFEVAADYDGDTIADWMEATTVFESFGFEWGGRWKTPKTDKPHFQKTFGYTWKQLLALHNSKSFITNTNFVKLT